MRGLFVRNPAKLNPALTGALLLAIMSAPFAVAKYPSPSDYYSHVGGFYVMLHDAELAHYYSFHWSLIGNLGADLIVAALGPLMGAESAGRLVFATVPGLTTAGLLLLSRQAHGRIQPTVLFALPLIYGFPFNYGFLNYCLGLGVAFIAAAGWIELRDRPAIQAMCGALLAGVVWVCHFAAFGVFLVIIAAHALVWKAPSPRGVAVLVAPAAWPLLLTILWRSGSSSDGLFFAWEWKLHWVADFLRAEWKWLDRASAAFILCAVAALFLFWMRERKSGAALIIAGGLLSVLFVILPDQVFGSTFTDARLVPPALMLLLTGLPAPRRFEASIAGVGAIFVAVRLLYASSTWQARSKEIEAELRVLDHIRVGTRIAVLSYASGCEGWPMFGLDHLASLAIPRKQAFVNTLWDSDSASLTRPIYNRGRAFNDATSGGIRKPGSKCVGEPLELRLRQLPRERFDYVWSFVGPLPGMAPVAQGQRGILYELSPTSSGHPRDEPQ